MPSAGSWAGTGALFCAATRSRCSANSRAAEHLGALIDLLNADRLHDAIGRRIAAALGTFFDDTELGG